MRDSVPQSESSLEPDVRRRIDEACSGFEQALRLGQRPAIEACLARVAADERDPLVYELLRLELEYRLGQSHRPTAEE